MIKSGIDTFCLAVSSMCDVSVSKSHRREQISFDSDVMIELTLLPKCLNVYLVMTASLLESPTCLIRAGHKTPFGAVLSLSFQFRSS